jgi:hypothetical protein
VTVSLPAAPDAILTAADVAAWLKITPRQVQRLGVPCFRLGPRTSRYLARDVLAWLEAQRQAPAPRRRRRPVPTGPGASAPPLAVSRDM